ncbi:unnamed protein product [Caenorhabditis sp. 36 PRJEB53466]|nr:unnamed protein product [Caenorhabditis sp. 36 PRJEB53466]
MTPNTKVLDNDKVIRLYRILHRPVEIHNKMANGREPEISCYPTLSTTLFALISFYLDYFRDQGIPIREARLVGGAASHVLCLEQRFTDFDVLFVVDPEKQCGNLRQLFSRPLTAAEIFLKKLLWSDGEGRWPMNRRIMESTYISKKFLHLFPGSPDEWSLLTFHNMYGCNVELKFVRNMAREFEFATDSLQIDLAPMLKEFLNGREQVIVKSLFASVDLVEAHISQQRIDTLKPSEIRGGGFLKFCLLKIKGFKEYRRGRELHVMKREMVETFLRDFDGKLSVISARHPVIMYMKVHLPRESEEMKMKFINQVQLVVKETYESHESQAADNVLINMMDLAADSVMLDKLLR